MDECSPSCSKENATLFDQTDDLDEIKDVQGVSVWGEYQEVLEEQALKELEIFAKDNQAKSKLEDGEIIEDEQPTHNDKNVHALDINVYIKQQAEFKKRQDHKRSLSVSDKSKLVADKISKNLSENVGRGVKRKLIESNTTDNKRKSIDKEVAEKTNDSGSEYDPSDGYDSEYPNGDTIQKTPNKRKASKSSHQKVQDDGNLESYKNRLDAYYNELNAKLETEDNVDEDVIVETLKIPVEMWSNLYNYQQEGIKWLWTIHRKGTGGILGDEMGLGKTVQMIVFLFALEHSKVISGRYKGLGPTIIVCPATVIHQWVQHFHQWTPELRVVVLHQSGTFTGDKNHLIKEVNKHKGVIITTYSGVLIYEEVLTGLGWHYVILDEGHKIRNHAAKVSVAVKKLHTPHRIILTGSPMQNNLQELWSLFDFTYPGLLGALPIFMEHLATPIIQGGFSNATPMQEATALSVATALKTMITPYLLRRTKNSVRNDINLPNKSEQVLFCSLTDEQRDLYKGYLMSDYVSTIVGKKSKNWFSENSTRCNVFKGITTLRKICNHPELYLEEADDARDGNRSEFYKRSGKMIVVSALLKIWKKQGHRILLFTQSKGMINIFCQFLEEQGYKYLKMDGGTNISSRQPLIDTFNKDNSYEVFLLTTRVGGLGVNLTGANRVIIYDPDWNPATDTQARERAWRIGQDKQVTVYRLLTSGTIEEKMYQRQVWKQLLSNKVLIDPRTQKFFNSSNLHDLFSLQEQTETANIFRNSRVNLQEKIDDRKREKEEEETVTFSNEKILEMKRRAQLIAKSIGQNKSTEQKKLDEEKEKLKRLAPAELLQLNRRKAEQSRESSVNTIDDSEIVDFDKALDISQSKANLYRKSKQHDKGKGKKSIMKEKVKFDESGTLDGEIIEGLVKREIRRKPKKEKKIKPEDEGKSDDYVLGKLFSKKGVSSALHHEEVIQSGYKDQNRLRIDNEAEKRRDEALQALRRSRLETWRW